MKTDNAVDPIYARDCYDTEYAKQKDSVPLFCEFNLASNEFSWINETIQYTYHQDFKSKYNHLTLIPFTYL
jgi:hypothetical protein